MNKKGTISTITVMSLKAGNEQAFKVVYDHFSERLYGNLLRLVKSEDVARELLQEVFLKVWEKRHSIDPDKSFHAYLFRIAENLVYDFFRKIARDKKLQIHLLAHTTEVDSTYIEERSNNEYNDLLQQAIEALPPRRRQIFRLCKLNGKSYEEVALQLNISLSTISDHIVKATRFIRTYCYTHHDILLVACLFMLFAGV